MISTLLASPLYFFYRFFKLSWHALFINYMESGHILVHEVFSHACHCRQLLPIFIEYLLWVKQYIPNALHTSSHLSITKTLWGRQHYHTWVINEQFVSQSVWIPAHTESKGAIESVFETKSVWLPSLPTQSLCYVVPHHTLIHTR